MLVITRKKGESLCLGRDIIITVTDIRSGRVSLGIKAPRDLEIIRKTAEAQRSAGKDNNKDKGLKTS